MAAAIIAASIHNSAESGTLAIATKLVLTDTGRAGPPPEGLPVISPTAWLEEMEGLSQQCPHLRQS